MYFCPKTKNDQWLVEEIFQNKKGGKYLEIGAGAGIGDSATYTLWSEFEWTGISVEPHPFLYNQFLLQRNSPCLNILLSNHVGYDKYICSDSEPYLSSIKTSLRDIHKDKAKAKYRELTFPCLDFPTLLSLFYFPFYQNPDFVCMDIEGSELMCLRKFPFDLCKPSCFIFEMSDKREITQLMTSHGYKEVKNKFNVDAPWEGYFLRDE